MAYSKSKLLTQALQAIKKHNLYFIEEVTEQLPCDRATFYRLLPPGSDENDTIKEALEANRIAAKRRIRRNLIENADNPTAQIAIYRMIATPEERDAISTTRTDITTAGKEITATPITIEVIDKRTNPPTHEQ